MDFTITQNGDKHVVAVAGRLDAVTASEFDAQSEAWIADGHTQLVLDLHGLEYISSAGLRSILTTAKKLKAGNGSIAFCCLSGMVEEVFSVSGFGAMFPMFKSLDEALA